jgi:hypothetical protein
VPAKVTKLIGLKNNRILSPINLVIFAGTQNGQYLDVHCDDKTALACLKNNDANKLLTLPKGY